MEQTSRQRQIAAAAGFRTLEKQLQGKGKALLDGHEDNPFPDINARGQQSSGRSLANQVTYIESTNLFNLALTLPKGAIAIEGGGNAPPSSPPPSVYVPALNYTDARNSQYLGAGF